MSRLARLLPPVAAARRSYSIFASKSRAGRFFTSAKSSKVIAQSTSKTTPAATTSNASNGSSSPTPDAGDPKPAEDVGSPLSQQPAAEFSAQNTRPPVPASSMASPSIDFIPTRPHPIVKPNDLVLHQFFSLHRPFLLLNQPTTSLFESVPSELPSASAFPAPPSPLGTIDDPPVASADADADAARQLSRALVMNRVGNFSDWKGALARLGLDVKEPAPPVSVEVHMDSTKRKRRKKMKKHKLKKRRRLQRAKRLRLGK